MLVFETVTFCVMFSVSTAGSAYFVYREYARRLRDGTLYMPSFAYPK